MHEKELKISLRDDVHVYGMYSRGNSKSIVIFIHGFPGSSNDVLFVDAAHYFLQGGFSTYRMSLYAPSCD